MYIYVKIWLHKYQRISFCILLRNKFDKSYAIYMWIKLQPNTTMYINGERYIIFLKGNPQQWNNIDVYHSILNFHRILGGGVRMVQDCWQNYFKVHLGAKWSEDWTKTPSYFIVMVGVAALQSKTPAMYL